MFVWKEELFNNLLSDLQGLERSQDEDVRLWRLEEGGSFPVKSIYKKLEGMSEEENRWAEDENGWATSLGSLFWVLCLSFAVLAVLFLFILCFGNKNIGGFLLRFVWWGRGVVC